MGEMVKQPEQQHALAKPTLPEKMRYAQALAESGLLPSQYRKQPANLLYAIEFADALGLSPMAAITGVHVIDGRPSASAGLISALVRRAGHKLRVTGDDKSATAIIVRCDDPTFEFKSTWTFERARAAGLTNKSVWKSYPAAMLKARAITEVARDACQEALSGVQYTPEELGATVNGDGDVVDVEPIRRERVQPAATKDGHDDEWEEDRPKFCAALGEIDIDYSDAAAWCESLGKLRPSQMGHNNRRALYDYIAGPGRAKFDAWLAARQPAEPEPAAAEPEVVDKPMFEDEPATGGDR